MLWKPISRRIYVHSPHLQIEDVEYELPNGRRSTYSLNHAGSRTVCVLALTPDHRVVLARQFRPGPGQVVDELPGGNVEAEEDWETCARRELLEETGYVPAKMIALGRFLECAYSKVERRGFLALECERRAEQNLDEKEFVEVVLKSLPEFVAQIRRGDSTDSEVAWSGLCEAGLVQFPR